MTNLSQQIQQTSEPIKLIGDIGAGSVSLAAILGWVPHIAAVASLIWVILRIYSEYLDIRFKRKRDKDA